MRTALAFRPDRLVRNTLAGADLLLVIGSRLQVYDRVRSCFQHQSFLL